MNTHRSKTCFTAGEVVRMIREDSYRVKVSAGQFKERHENQLRGSEPDIRGKHVSLDCTTHDADLNDDHAEQDGYTVNKILDQHRNASLARGLGFQVRLQGYWAFHDT